MICFNSLACEIINRWTPEYIKMGKLRKIDRKILINFGTFFSIILTFLYNPVKSLKKQFYTQKYELDLENGRSKVF